MATKVSKIYRLPHEGHARVCKEPGDPEKVLYTSRVRDDGVIELVESGKEDLYAYIQSHKDSCDIHVLLARYQNGDLDVLSKVQGAYGDFTDMPETYAELLNAVIAGENYFNSLPVEVRAKFDHSLEKFMVAMDDMPSFLQKLGVDVENQPSPNLEQQQVEPVAKEVPNDGT